MARHSPSGRDLADAYLEHLRRGGTSTPEAFLAEQGETSEEARELLRIAAHLTEERPFRPPPGRVLGDYRLLSEIGRGGMGTVYLATQAHAGPGAAASAPVAIKVLHPHLLARRGAFERFQREAESGRRVRHVNVVPTLQIGSAEADGWLAHFLVMEYVQGRTLRTLLSDLGTVPEALAREIARQIAAGLAAIHEAGIVHRDLKPENVLVTDDHQVRIMDLGVARVLAEGGAITREGEFAGSIHYAAPEQLAGGRADASSDLYALGVVLYELISGRNPFALEDARASLRAHLELVPPPLDELGTDVSPFLAAVVGTLLNKEPRARFDAAASLHDALADGEGSTWWQRREADPDRSLSRPPRLDVRRRTRLHGRAADLAALRSAWARARSGGGSCVLLVGEAGIGKTRLLDVFLHEVAGTEADILYGSYPPGAGVDGVAGAVRTRFGSGLEVEIRDLLDDAPALVGPYVAALQNEPPPPGTEPLSTGALHAASVRLLQALAARSPLVWVIDDLHFARPEERKLALSLARGVAGHPALLLLTARPELPEPDLSAFARIETLERRDLARLTRNEVVELLRDAFRSESLTLGLGDRIAAASDGVPLFLFEIVSGLEEGGFVRKLPDGSWVEARRVEAIEAPPAVRDLVATRLQGLSREERAVLDAASVQGYEFDPDLLARARGRSTLEILETLGHVARRSGLVRGRGNRFGFDHHQVQEVLQADLPAALRMELHAALADALVAREAGADGSTERLVGESAAFVATHHLQGSRPGRALPFVEAALAFLEPAQRNEEVVMLLERALALPDPLPTATRIDWLLRLAERLTLLGRRDACDGVLEQAEAASRQADDPRLLARTLGMRGLHLMQVDRHAEAEDVLRRGRDAARRGGSKALEARILGTLGAVLWYVGRQEESNEANEEQLRLARETGDKRTETTAYVNLGNHRVGVGRFEEAIAYEERAIALAPEAGYRYGEAAAVGNLGHIHFVLGNLEEALGHVRRHVALTREIGYRHGEVMALVNLGSLLSTLGDPEAARPWLEQALHLSREIDTLSWHAYTLLPLSVVEEQQGNPDEARRCAAAAFDGLQRARSLDDLVPAGLRLGALLAKAGEHEAARTHLEESAALAHRSGSPPAEALCACHLAALVGAPAADAVRAFDEHGASLGLHPRMEARHLLWRATGDRTHLDAAHRLLLGLVARSPVSYRESMKRCHPLHRAILEDAATAP